MEDRVTTPRAILTIFLAILVLALAQGMASMIFLIPIPEMISTMIFTLCYVVLAYWGVKAICQRVLKLSLRECRIDRPHIQLKWFICAIVLPFAVMTILLLTPGEFVYNDLKALEATEVVITAVFVSGIGAGIVEEFIFRGLIMKTLEKRWGKTAAILVPSIMFGLLHALGTEMDLINLLLLVVGGTSVGIMFSIIVYESGSVWNSAIVHGLWNIIVIGDILHIGALYNESSIFSYKLLSHSNLLTGGAFGIEVSIVSILGYWAVIGSILIYKTKKLIS